MVLVISLAVILPFLSSPDETKWKSEAYGSAFSTAAEKDSKL